MMGYKSVILLLWWYATVSSSKYAFPQVKSTTLSKLRELNKSKLLKEAFAQREGLKQPKSPCKQEEEFQTPPKTTAKETQKEKNLELCQDQVNTIRKEQMQEEAMVGNVLKRIKSHLPTKPQNGARVFSNVKANIVSNLNEAEQALMTSATKLYIEVGYDYLRENGYLFKINNIRNIVQNSDWIRWAINKYDSQLTSSLDKIDCTDRPYASRNALLNLLTQSCKYIQTDDFFNQWYITEVLEKFRDDTLAIAEHDQETQRAVNELQQAAAGATDSTIKFLIQKKVNINLKTFVFFGKNALMFAAENGLSDFVDVLVNNGANPNIKTWWLGKTVLMLAADSNKTDAVDVLIKKGAKVNAKIFLLFGKNALMFAAEKGYDKVVKVLLEKGARAEAKTWPWGKSATWFAEKSGHQHIAQIIKKHIYDSANKARRLEEPFENETPDITTEHHVKPQTGDTATLLSDSPN